jgi:hypothetical protein
LDWMPNQVHMTFYLFDCWSNNFGSTRKRCQALAFGLC